MRLDGECKVVIGPPGTGKTTSQLQALCREIEDGTPPERIAFVTFTRAACREACDRIERDLGLGRDAMPWARTIHSTAYKLLGVRHDQIMAAEAWRDFGKKYGYDLSEFVDLSADTPAEPPRRTEADEYRYLVMWARNRRLSLDEALRRFSRWVSVPQAISFAKRARDYKTTNGLLDFTDLLELSIGNSARPDVDVAFIDEAQDLSPLQIALVEQWFAPCRCVYVAGDDDQAIYGFQGAEPDWLLSLCEEHGCEVLEQSYRVPRVVHQIAERIIARNRRRVPKAYRPRPEDGELHMLTAEDALRSLDPSTTTLVLARNRMFLKTAARTLYDRRVPYFVEGAGGVNPFGRDGAFAAVSAARTLAQGRGIRADALRDLFAFVPSRGADLLPHGVKAQVARSTRVFSPSELRGDLGLGVLLDRIASGGPTSVLLKLDASDRQYFGGLIERYGDIAAPKIHLTTIHASKGRQADTVVVLPDMTRSSYEESMDSRRFGAEAENRVAYVAATRAERRLILARPSARRFFNYPAVRRPAELVSC